MQYGLKVIFLAIRKRIYLLLGKRYVLKKRLGGIILLDIINYVDRQVEAYRFYERRQNEYFKDVLFAQKCSVFIDVGAHWGYYSLMLALDNRFDTVEIHAFEPDKINRAQLYANVFLNGLVDKINVYDEGVSNENGIKRFNVHQNENRGRSCIAEQGGTEIKVCRLDDRISYTDKVIGIKIDVEGHELQALEGMSAILKNNKCILQIESFNESGRKIQKLLGDCQYKLINTIDNDYYYIKRL